MQWLSDWWNDIELWMAQQSFWLQFALVIVVVGPLCVGVAWLIDRLVDRAATRFGPARRSGHKLDPEPEPELEPGDQPAGTAS